MARVDTSGNTRLTQQKSKLLLAYASWRRGIDLFAKRTPETRAEGKAAFEEGDRIQDEAFRLGK